MRDYDFCQAAFPPESTLTKHSFLPALRSRPNRKGIFLDMRPGATTIEQKSSLFAYPH